MAESVYHRLREWLDVFSVGFPSTASGVEIKLLKHLFSEEEAEMFLSMTPKLESPESVAERTGKESEHTAALLDTMAEKGLLFRLKKGEALRYGAVPFVVGLFEYQVKDMDRELAELCEAYFQEAFLDRCKDYTALMRPIPVNRSIEVGWPVAPYEDAKEIIKGKELIAVAPCICRVQQQRMDHACDKPLEVCFMFGAHAKYYIDRDMGRQVTQEEAYKILDQCEEAGLVTQPFNAQNPGGMCNCCGDCCNMLRALKQHPNPVEVTISNYYAEVDPDACVACETCLDRCQMDAISMSDDDVAQIDLRRCIGCGLCVTTCPSEALSLKPKLEGERRDPPEKAVDTLMQMAQQRGVFGAGMGKPA